jgi:hypothetical protein
MEGCVTVKWWKDWKKGIQEDWPIRASNKGKKTDQHLVKWETEKFIFRASMLKRMSQVCYLLRKYSFTSSGCE